MAIAPRDVGAAASAAAAAAATATAAATMPPPRSTPAATAAAKARLRWGLWLPPDLERRYMHAAHQQCPPQDAAFYALFLAIHLPQLACGVIPAPAVPVIVVGAVRSGLGSGLTYWLEAKGERARAGQRRKVKKCVPTQPKPNPSPSPFTPLPRRAKVVWPVAMLLLIRRAPAFYRRHREALALAGHLVMTLCRAAAVRALRAHAAVGAKGGGSASADEAPLALLLRVAMVSGVLFRVLEPLGLWIPWSQQAAVSALYLARHAALGWGGMRLAAANVLFLAFHRLHDAVGGVAGAALGALSPAAAAEPAACAACPGLAVWWWACSALGTAVPLYAVARVERAAKLRWLAQLRRREARAAAAAAAVAAAAAAATATSAAAGPSAPPALAAPDAWRRLPQGGGGSGSSDASGGSGGSSHHHGRADGGGAPPARIGPPAWLEHLGWLLALSVLCWAAASFLAHSVAPRVLPRAAYHAHCPVAMPTPFLASTFEHG